MTPEEVPADLDVAIRERLVLDGDSHYFRYDSEMIQGAVLAVLDLHGPGSTYDPNDEKCLGCNDYYYLCLTRRAIAEKLGIEL